MANLVNRAPSTAEPATPPMENAPSLAKRRGRRPSHDEHWTKVTVVLLDRQIAFLDRLGADIRSATGCAISRAHIIRGLVDALGESDLDLTNARSEAELHGLLTRRLGPRLPASPRAR